MSRELDAQVAEKVFGMSAHPAREDGQTEYEREISAWGEWVAYHHGKAGNLPPFSTDLSAAGQVIEKMRERGWDHSHSSMCDKADCRVVFDFFHDDGRTGQATALFSEAICLAALKALDNK